MIAGENMVRIIGKLQWKMVEKITRFQLIKRDAMERIKKIVLALNLLCNGDSVKYGSLGVLVDNADKEIL